VRRADVAEVVDALAEGRCRVPVAPPAPDFAVLDLVAVVFFAALGFRAAGFPVDRFVTPGVVFSGNAVSFPRLPVVPSTGPSIAQPRESGKPPLWPERIISCSPTD
jgi:hypothetical protein